MMNGKFSNIILKEYMIRGVVVDLASRVEQSSGIR